MQSGSRPQSVANMVQQVPLVSSQVTSAHPNEVGWSNANLPNLLFQLEPPADWGMQPLRELVNQSNHPIMNGSRTFKHFPLLPNRISINPHEDFRLEMWRDRTDPRITTNDLWFRMHPGAGEKRIDQIVMNQRCVRFRKKLGLTCWTRQTKVPSTSDCLLLEQLSPESIKRNTVLPVTRHGIIKPSLDPNLSWHRTTYLPLDTFTNGRTEHTPSEQLTSYLDVIHELQTKASQLGCAHWIFLPNKYKPETWYVKAKGQENGRIRAGKSKEGRSNPDDVLVPAQADITPVALEFIKGKVRTAASCGHPVPDLRTLSADARIWVGKCIADGRADFAAVSHQLSTEFNDLYPRVDIVNQRNIIDNSIKIEDQNRDTKNPRPRYDTNTSLSNSSGNVAGLSGIYNNDRANIAGIGDSITPAMAPGSYTGPIIAPYHGSAHTGNQYHGLGRSQNFQPSSSSNTRQGHGIQTPGTLASKKVKQEWIDDSNTEPRVIHSPAVLNQSQSHRIQTLAGNGTQKRSREADSFDGPNKRSRLNSAPIHNSRTRIGAEQSIIPAPQDVWNLDGKLNSAGSNNATEEDFNIDDWLVDVTGESQPQQPEKASAQTKNSLARNIGLQTEKASVKAANELIAKYALIEAENNQLKAENNDLKKQKTLLQNQKKTIQEDHDTLRDRNSATHARNLILEEQIVSVQADNRSLKAQYTSLQTEYTTLQTIHTSLQTDHTSLRTEPTSLQTDHTSLRTEYTSLQTDHISLQNQLSMQSRSPSERRESLPTPPTSISPPLTQVEGKDSEQYNLADQILTKEDWEVVRSSMEDPFTASLNAELSEFIDWGSVDFDPL